VSTAATTDHNVFEGLFGKLFQPEGAFKEDLRAAGYDTDKPELRYPTSVLLASLDVAARHVYPELPREEAHRQIGQRFSARYLTTILGRIIRTLVLALGVDRFIMNLPKVVSLSTTGLTAEVKKLDAPGEYLVTFKGENQSPDFIAGAIEGGAQDLSVFKVRAEVTRRAPAEFDMKVTGLTR
jgi:uncharacterized protein (TIGR02265 family)